MNLWDWDVGASWDDGKTWAGWQQGEKSPGSCGEGGGGQGMGASGKTIMFHRNHWWSSLDGGHNWLRGNLPGGAGSFDYLRQAGSRSEPNGTCFSILTSTEALKPGSAKAGDGGKGEEGGGSMVKVGGGSKFGVGGGSMPHIGGGLSA